MLELLRNCLRSSATVFRPLTIASWKLCLPGKFSESIRAKIFCFCVWLSSQCALIDLARDRLYLACAAGISSALEQSGLRWTPASPAICSNRDVLRRESTMLKETRKFARNSISERRGDPCAYLKSLVGVAV